MLFISARLEIDPAHADAYIAAAEAIVAPTRAEKGCNVYAFSRDIVDSNIVWISEEWDSEEDLMAHLSTPHIADFLKKTQAFNILSMDARKYEIASVSPMGVPEN